MLEWVRQVLEAPQLGVAALPAAVLLGAFGAASSCCSAPALGVIAGYSGTREGADRRSTVVAGLFFMLGTVIALAVLGAVAGFVSQAAGTVLGRYWRVFAGLAAIFFGLAALNLVPFKLPKFGSRGGTPHRGLLGAAAFGLVVGGSATTCTVSCNPVLAVALGVATLQGHTLWGAAILASFAAGFSVPLAAILVGLSLGRSALKAKKVATAVRIAGGVLLVGAGFYFLVTV